MTDRELLELAAKAAGVAVHHWSHVDCPDCPDAVPVLTDGINTEIVVWNPLADDGDALRLAVKLGMTVCIDYAKLKVSVWDGRSEWGSVSLSSDGININKDPYAATRRAIVRAAAETGRAMK